MIIVGERINSSRSSIEQAIEKRDAEFIQNEAIIQANAGADYIDVNAGTFYKEEEDQLSWLVRTVQAVTDRPLCIDTANSKALLSGLTEHKGKGLVNSISMESERLENFLSVIKSYPCRVIGLCLNDLGAPKTVEGRVEIADSLINLLIKMVHALSAEEQAALITLGSIKAIKERHSEVSIICGISNVSFGLPGRGKLNQAFLALAIRAGIDAALLDPTDQDMMATIKSVEALLGQDEFCMEYISHFRNQ
jgi:5-methyltetrahydrofolate--homocysteine methyltransferase